MSEAATTDDGFLGGALSIVQPAKGYRAGIDAVFLAACVPAKAGESVFEAGCGVGVAALCLAHRAVGVEITAFEIEPEMVELARRNAERNGLSTRCTVLEGDVRQGAAAAGLSAEGFDHAMANPPFHAAGRARASDDAHKARAHVFKEGDLDVWVRFLVGVLRPGGTLSLVYPASELTPVLNALVRRVGGAMIYPLFPRAGEPASRILVQGRKGSRAASQLLPGMVLHGEGHGFTAQAEDILRHGAALNLE